MAQSTKNKHLTAGGLYMFPPTDAHLSQEYPALNIHEFKPLDKKELDFVWYYANRTSPYYNQFQPSADAAFVNSKKTFTKADFTADIEKACERMRLYEPDLRQRLYKLTFDTMNNYEKILNDQKLNLEESGSDIGVADKYVKVTTQILEQVPKMIEALENNGVVKIENGEMSETNIFKESLDLSLKDDNENPY